MSDRKEVTTQTTERLQKSLEGQSPEKVQKEVKSRRGRKIKYNTDEERIEARRRQQKAYRERKKKELLLLKELVEKNNGLNESLRSKAPKKEQALMDSIEQEELDE